MPFKKVNVVKQGEKLIIDGLGVEPFEQDSLEVLRFESGNVLIGSQEEGLKNGQSGSAWIPSYLLKDILVGLSQKKWNGSVSVETSSGRKVLYLVNGEITFARSNLIDDRLGEVIYRQGILTLDQLTNCAAKVNKEQKFGQVLVNSGFFTDTDLWLALRDQVTSIIRSIFFDENVAFELTEGRKPRTEIKFLESTEEVLEKCVSYGKMIRDFEHLLTEDSEVLILKPDKPYIRFQANSYLEDMVRIIGEGQTFRGLVESSRVQKKYTIATLLYMTSKKYCHIVNMKQQSADQNPSLWLLKNRVSLLRSVTTELALSADQEGVNFPASELEKLVQVLDGKESIISLDQTGKLKIMSFSLILSQAASSSFICRHYESVIDSIVKLALQICSDNLSSKCYEKILNIYRIFSEHEIKPKERKRE